VRNAGQASGFRAAGRCFNQELRQADGYISQTALPFKFAKKVSFHLQALFSFVIISAKIILRIFSQHF